MEKKKRIKLWGRINLFETSCVGLPMYPAAHKSYSLVKVLMETESPEEPSDQLNIKENQMPEENVDKPEGEAEAKPEEAKPEVKPEEAKPEEAEAKPEGEESTDKSIDMTDMLTKALLKAINQAEVQRGLVSPEEKVEKMQEVLKTKSLGELAIMQGLFSETVGNPVEIK